MKINIDEQQNKYFISKIDFNKSNIVLFAPTQEISLDYAQVTLRIKLQLGNEEQDTLSILQNTFNETSASESFHTFRNIQQNPDSVCLATIILSLETPQQTYVIPMDGLFDLLLDMLKEAPAFKHISYRIENDKPGDPARLAYAKKIAADLDKVLEEIKPKPAPAVSIPAPETNKPSINAPVQPARSKAIWWVVGAVGVVAIVLLAVWLIK